MPFSFPVSNRYVCRLAAGLLLEIRANLYLHQLASRMVPAGDVNEGEPFGGLRPVVVVLGLEPLDECAVPLGGAVASDNEQHQAALVAMLARDLLDVMDEHPPVLERGLGELLLQQVPLDVALPVQ